MKVLGIDTSNLVLSVAVVDGNKLLGEYTTNLKKNHSIRLMPAISMLLEEVEVEPGDLCAISVAHGPGSYTGVRIGVTTAKSMAWALGIPLIGVSSLQAVAGNAMHFAGKVSPLFDARRGQIYTALFANGGRIAEDAIRMTDEWAHQLREEGAPVLFLGDDVQLHRQAIINIMGNLAHFAPAEWNVPRAAYVAREGREILQQGQNHDVNSFVPQYLQLAEAESKWLASQADKGGNANEPVCHTADDHE